MRGVNKVFAHEKKEFRNQNGITDHASSSAQQLDVKDALKDHAGNALHMTTFKLSDTDLIQVAIQVRKSTTLRELKLTNGQIGSVEGVSALSSAVETHICLVSMNLANNFIDAEGFALLARALQNNTSLLNLDLSYNHAGDEGVEAIAKALATNRTLRDISLSRNLIGPKGAAALANCITENDTLKTLNVLDNNLGGRGIGLIAEAMDKNTSITNLLLSKKRYRAEKELEHVLSRNKMKEVSVAIEDVSTCKKKTLWHCSKLMVVGEAGVGKTATVRALLNEPYNSEWESTIGVSMSKVRIKPRGWELVNSSVLAFDSENKKLAKERKEMIKITPNTKFQYRFALQIPRIRISIWDFGGRPVFHALQQFFLTTLGVYLVVFNCRKAISDSAYGATYMTFWLNCIAMHAPDAPVVLVGTFSKEVESLNMWKDLDSCISEICKPFSQIVKASNQRIFFPIDNSTSRGLEELRYRIHDLIRTEKTINAKLPLKWIKCLKTIVSGERNWLYFSSIRKIANKHGIESAEEMEHMLNLFHERGIFLHYTFSKFLKSIVITSPYWLISAMGKVIRDSSIHPFDREEMNRAGLEKDADLLFKNALASKDLLQHCWGKQHLHFILSVMKSMLLVSSWNVGVSNEFYLVPSMLKRPETSWTINGKKFFEFEFDELPDGVFERLVCLCVEYSSSVGHEIPPQLFKGKCSFHLGMETQVYIAKTESSVQVYASSVEGLPQLLRMMKYMLMKIRHNGTREKFTYDVMIVHDGQRIPYRVAENKRMKPWFDEKASHVSSPNMKAFIELNI